MPVTVVEYVREDGLSPYRTWFNRLHAQAAAKIATAVARLEMGHTASVKWIGAIAEYRVDWGPGFRIYFAKDGDALVILLGGGTEKSQRTDAERAKGLWEEYRSRKRAALRPRSKG